MIMAKLYLPRIFSKNAHDDRIGVTFSGWTDMVDGEQIYVDTDEYAHELSEDEIAGDYYLAPGGDKYDLQHYVDSPNGKYTFSSDKHWEVEDVSLK